jgi:hypothetical protein
LSIQGDEDEAAFSITLFDKSKEFKWKIKRSEDKTLGTEEQVESEPDS